MSAIAERFERARASRETMLVAYVTAGDPDFEQSANVLRALDAAGAGIVEVGVPFSDPVADGPAIQRAVERALAAGGTLTRSLDLIEAVKSDMKAPIVLFTYVNPVLRMGIEPFIDRAAAVGVDGVLLLDLPIEESASMQAALDRRGIDQIFLVSPTTTDDRLKEAGRLGRGFLYAISRLGVTGARDSVAGSAAPLVARIRQVTAMPIALGFGISRPEHVAEVTAFADAAVVGSAIVQVIEQCAAAGRPAAPDVEQFVRWLTSGRGHEEPAGGPPQ
jgi:tryptophan synthase alpha chain